MFLLVILTLGDLLHCACSNYTADKCVANDTQHRNCLVTENNTCAEKCINADLYEATGDNKKCIVKACNSYNEKTCYLNDACVLTEQSPTKCASSCLDFKVYLPVEGRCVKSGCTDREPKSLSVFIKVNRVKFNYGYKSNNNVGVTVMGIQKNTSFYSNTSSTTDFEYKEPGFEWNNVRAENVENVRVQVYTDKQYFIGQAYLNLSEYKTPEGVRKNITVESGDVTIPNQNQTLSIEVGICTACASADWPCGDSTESELCYQDQDNCSPTCTNTDVAHYNPDPKTGICERLCEERKHSGEDVWPCGNDYESNLCYVDTGAGKGEPECARECSQSGWYAVKTGGDRCELKDCTAREANLTSTHPCGSATECLYNPVSGKCVTQCPSDANLTGDSSAGVCVVACALRPPNITAAHPCQSAEDCFFDPVSAKCIAECPVDENHTGASDSGRCVTGVNCPERPANLTAKLPCGDLQDCLYDPLPPPNGTACVASCLKDQNHTGEIEDGWCELACALIKANASAEFPCGDDDCFFDPLAPANGSQCVDACVNAGHTGKADENGVCILACAARKANVTAVRPCGDALDCQLDPTVPAGGACVDACVKSAQLTGESEAGVCVLTCSYRIADHSATYPCGHKQDCFLDLAVKADGNQCVEKCPIDEGHTGEIFSGRCELGLNCAARKPQDPVAAFPCGALQDCFYEPDKSACVAECSIDTTHLGEAEDGVCAPTCAVRKADVTADYPCGSGLYCVFDPAAGEGEQQCLEACVKDDTHTGEADVYGVCELDLTDRSVKGKTSWWDGKIFGLPRLWFVVIVGAAALLLIIIIIVIIVVVKKKKKKPEEDGYVAINSDS